ncbi:UPF0489 family protein [Burkholderia cepacia]|uniref:UPF0489 family protein n=1 Tax=Burkholderia cepacia TaxID=292 RepID=UPI003EDF67E5
MKTIGGKDVYIVKDHHHVLGGWAEVRRRQEQAGTGAPTLLTLDHHNDTRPPFDNHCYWTVHPAPGMVVDRDTVAINAMADGLLNDLTWTTKASVNRAIANLKHDEHILAAIRTGILSRALVIHLEPAGTPAEHVHLARSGCDSIGCTKAPHDNACAIARADQVLESRHLDHELRVLDAKARANGEPGALDEPYILDIDLDYFHSENAIAPKDPATFYRLAQGALAITIAKEPGCVKSLRLPGSKITGKSLLADMLQQIQVALT